MIDVDVAVIGGGPAGVAAAMEASRAGLAVALVEEARVGGRAAFGTMLAWRALERAADEKGTFADAREAARHLAVRWEERQALRLADAGVTRLTGRASFVGPGRLSTDRGELASFEQAIVACGAEARVLPGDLPDGRRLLTPDQVLGLEALPREVLVIGGGAAAAELCDALSRLGGVRLTWVMDELGLLPSFDRELAEAVGDVLMERGVKLVHGKAVSAVALTQAGVALTLEGGKRYEAPLAIAAIGARPRLDGLGLAALGIEQLRIDDQGRAAPGLFVVGECTGRAPSSAAAEAMGRVAGKAAAGSTRARYEPLHVPIVARTRPLIAQVGQTPERVAGRAVIFHTLRLEETTAGLLARIAESDAAKGLARVVCDSESGRVLGATAVGPGAEELTSAVGLAMGLGATDEQLADLFAASPSALEALGRATR